MMLNHFQKVKQLLKCIQKFNDPTPPKKNIRQERLEPKTPLICLPISGTRYVAGASMVALVSSASRHTPECSEMSSDMVIIIRNRIEEQQHLHVRIRKGLITKLMAHFGCILC